MDRVATSWGNWVLFVVGAIFVIASVTSGLISRGFLEADGCTHYLYARFALEYPYYLVDTWGRPFKTLWYVPAAQFGLHGVRVWSCVTALVVAWVSFRIAKRSGLNRPELAAIFVLGQPLVFMHSFSELTELPFAMLLGGTFLAYQSKRWWICALLASLLPLARPEGFGFILIFFLLLITQKRWKEIFLLPIPFVAWNFAGWWLYGKHGNPITWVFDRWPYSGDSLYQPGPIWHFAVALFVKVLGPPICLLMITGLVIGSIRSFRFARRARTIELKTSESGTPGSDDFCCESSTDPLCPTLVGNLFLDHNTQVRALLVAFPLIIFIGHSLLFWLGKMASSGEPRYMLIVAPFWAVLGAIGFESVVRAIKQSHEQLIAAIAATTIALAPTTIWQLHYPTIPITLQPDWIDTKSFAAWYNAEGRSRYPNLMAAHPGIFYHLDQANLALNTVMWNRQHIDFPPARTILVWDPTYGISNASLEKSVDLNRITHEHWKEITSLIPLSDQTTFRVYVHE